MKKILIVEDDKAIREVIKEILLENNFITETAEDGAAAIDYIKKHTPDMVILDLGLPKISGESVLSEIKKNFSKVFVIVLTAKNQSADIIRGFSLGADDYISKPFELEELMARIKVKFKENGDEKLYVDDLILDTSGITVERNGKSIKLSPHEFKLLQFLIQNKGRVLSREVILNRIWQYSYDVDSRVVDVYVGYLRKKIDGESEKKLISSVRGFGYTIKE